VWYEKVWIEWAPRQSQKGIVNTYQTDEVLKRCRRDDKGKPFLGPNLVAETAQWFGFNLTSGLLEPAFIPMSSTQLTPSRKWMTKAQAIMLKKKDGTAYQAPLFYQAYELVTRPTSDGQNDWFIWHAELLEGGTLPELFKQDLREVLAKCKALMDGAKAGRVRGDLEGERTDNMRDVGSGRAEEHNDTSRM
jgi:hypothetical protein